MNTHSTGFHGSSVVKNLPAVQKTRETQVRSLGQKDSMEKKMATYFSILAWKAARTGEPGGLQTTESQRIRHNWACVCTHTHTHTHTHTQWDIIQHKKEWIFAFCYKVDGPGRHYAKWNKSDRQRKILYVIIYMWTLNKNKISECNTKKKHKHREHISGYQ